MTFLSRSLGVVLFFAVAATLPAAAHKMTPKAKKREPVVESLGIRQIGDTIFTVRKIQNDELEFEVSVERKLHTPDPLTGDRMPLDGADIGVTVYKDKSQVRPMVKAHAEEEAGVYGAHFENLDPGPYVLWLETKAKGSQSATVQIPFSISTMPDGEASGVSEAEITMTHPFLAHMGLPDAPGAASLRATAIRRFGAAGGGNDLSVHVEAGLWGPLGIHIRNDAITNAGAGMPDEEPEDHGTEVMLMYGFLMNEARDLGLSAFVEIEVPTVQGEGDPVRAGFGLAGTAGWSNRLLFDGNVHVVPNSTGVEVEYESCLQFRVMGRVFLLLENRGEFGPEPAQVYLLPAIKVGMGNTPFTFGAGIQFPLTTTRMYERQAMFQLDWEF